MDDSTYRDHVRRLRNAIRDAPSHLYTDTDISPERNAARSELVDRAWDELGGDDIPKSRQGLILAGLPGSGKTTVFHSAEIPDVGMANENFLHIDPDYFKTKIIDAGLAPHLPGFSPMETAPLIHQESNDLAKELARRAYSQGTNIAWDYSLRHPHSGQSRMTEFDHYGYTPHGIYVHTDPQVAMQRTRDRHRADLEAYLDGQHPHGGRYVPPEIIANSIHDDRIANRDHYDKLTPYLTTSQIFDTTSSPTRRIAARSRLAMAGARLAEFSSQPLNVRDEYSMADFLQWCAHNHKQPTTDALTEFTALSGMNIENYLDIYLFLGNGGLMRQGATNDNAQPLFTLADIAPHLGIDRFTLYQLADPNKRSAPIPTPTHRAGQYALWDDPEPWIKWNEIRKSLPNSLGQGGAGGGYKNNAWGEWAREFQHDRPPQQLYTAGEIADHLGATRPQVKGWANRQDSPPHTHVMPRGNKGLNQRLWHSLDPWVEWYHGRNTKILPGSPEVVRPGDADLLAREFTPPPPKLGPAVK